MIEMLGNRLEEGLQVDIAADLRDLRVQRLKEGRGNVEGVVE